MAARFALQGHSSDESSAGSLSESPPVPTQQERHPVPLQVPLAPKSVVASAAPPPPIASTRGWLKPSSTSSPTSPEKKRKASTSSGPSQKAAPMALAASGAAVTAAQAAGSRAAAAAAARNIPASPGPKGEGPGSKDTSDKDNTPDKKSEVPGPESKVEGPGSKDTVDKDKESTSDKESLVQGPRSQETLQEPMDEKNTSDKENAMDKESALEKERAPQKTPSKEKGKATRPSPKRRSKFSSPRPKGNGQSPQLDGKGRSPRSGDKQPRAQRGTAGTFGGHRPPKNAEKRKIFEEMREEYYKSRAAVLGSDDPTSGSEVRGSAPGVRKRGPSGRNTTKNQQQFLAFMKKEMSELAAKGIPGAERMRTAASAWQAHEAEANL